MQDTPWTGRKSVAELTQGDRQPFTCLWTVRGRPSTQRELTQTQGEHANSTQKDPMVAIWWFQTQDPVRQKC